MPCGTGSGNWPQPGDPDLNNSLLTAVQAFGGIRVSWTYPGLNPEAVAHTILYRSTVDDFATAVQYRVVTGNSYFDRLEPNAAITYYYWIEIVSVNGTVGDTTGSAFAQALPQVDEYITLLTGQIDEGILATALQQEIQRIDQNYLDLLQEQSDRAANDDALGIQFNSVQAHSDATRALLVAETAARTSQNDAFVQQLNTAQVQLGDSIASVQTTLQAQIDDIEGGQAVWGAVVTVDDQIGGFALSNDGTTVEAGFDVDTFWIGRTDANRRKPFVMDGNGTIFMADVVIQDALIQDLTVGKLTAGTLGADMAIGTGRVIFESATHMKVQGLGFGANSDLLEWFGVRPAGANTAARIANMTKANAITYLSTDGDAYFGGTLQVGTLTTAVQTSSHSATASVETGNFGSNGNPITVNYSYTYVRDWITGSQGSANPNPTATVRLLRNGVVVATQNVTGTAEGPDLEDPGQYFNRQAMSGSWTYTDNVGGTADRNFELELTARSSIGSPDTQRLSIVTSED
jgi:hypothetical protein